MRNILKELYDNKISILEAERLILKLTKTTYLLDGKITSEEGVYKAKNAKLMKTINEKHYGTPDYIRKQDVNSYNYFAKLAEDREELERRHG
jgi:hypothetical protein